MPTAPNGPDRRPPRDHPLNSPEEVTATDLVVSPPEYLQEVHDALRRTEETYARGDLDETARLAEEGLATIRVTLPRLGPEGVPPHYRAFFLCFRVQPQYRAALGLFKQALLRKQQAQAGGEAEEFLRRAWQILGPAVADLEEGLAVEMLVTDHPTAGRVLRGVARLREHLRACMRARPGAETQVTPQLGGVALDPRRAQI